MTDASKDPQILSVNVQVDLDPKALERIVAHAKEQAPHDERGRPRVDTWSWVGAMISRFLSEKDFTTYVDDPVRYEVEK